MLNGRMGLGSEGRRGWEKGLRQGKEVNSAGGSERRFQGDRAAGRIGEGVSGVQAQDFAKKRIGDGEAGGLGQWV